MIFSKLFKKQSKETGTAASDNYASNAADSSRLAGDIGPAPETDETSEELIAVITAAIQSSFSYDPHNKLVIKSITRTGQNTPIWSRTGRLERINKKIQ